MEKSENSTEEKNIGPCGFCGALAEVKCANCKSAYYCDRNCQKRHWKEHKTACKTIKSTNDIKIVEPLDAVDISNLTIKVEVRKKANGAFGVFTTDYIKVLLTFLARVARALVQIKSGVSKRKSKMG